MPTAGEAAPPELLVDTSVAVPLVVADHAHHEMVSAAVGTRRLGLAGHAAFETYSVLTRLPAPTRRDPKVVEQVIRAGFPGSRFLDARDTVLLLERIAGLGIAGGAVYDALIGAVAAAHGIPLATRDARAADVYHALDVDLELLD